MRTYDVTVTREDNLWVADIVELTAATDVVRFADLDVEVRDLIVDHVPPPLSLIHI